MYSEHLVISVVSNSVFFCQFFYCNDVGDSSSDEPHLLIIAWYLCFLIYGNISAIDFILKGYFTFCISSTNYGLHNRSIVDSLFSRTMVLKFSFLYITLLFYHFIVEYVWMFPL